MNAMPLPELGRTTSFTRTLDADVVERFADTVGERDPIYLDEAFAARTPYGHRLAPGSLLVGLVNSALSSLTGPGYVLMGHELRFTGAVRVGDTVEVAAKVIRLREDKRIVSTETIVTRSDGQQALRAVGGLMQLELSEPAD